METVKSEKEIEVATKKALWIASKGKRPDRIRYNGDRGNFTLIFKNDKYTIEIVPNYRGFNYRYLEKVVCKGQKDD